AIVAMLLSITATAQPYPSKPVRYIVPFPAGATPDIVARLVADRFSRMWGQQVVVDNRPGAGGTVGAAFAAKSPPDGYTLFQCNIASSAIAEALYAKLPYDPQRDFAPLSRIGTTASMLVVHPSLPAASLQEFIAYARANPGKLSYGASAAGASPQLAMELFKLTAKIEVVHIAYKGAPQALSDVIGGQIAVSMQTAPAVLPALHGARVRALAVTSLKRMAQFPAVPTFDESGFPGFEVTTWYGLCAPAGTPVAILDKVHGDLVAVLHSAEVIERFDEQMLTPAPLSRAEFAQFIRAEAVRWAKVVRAAGIPQL
ncbi:MAG TPA: tripartite tricarboxylate transporter substrate binding protein, partial [Burkholderiales bacterium]|nr:tripartite tricarboxylate transporter substrate binding protein [Burkholderiales bacterium]